jgi:hypothetical protein
MVCYGMNVIMLQHGVLRNECNYVTAWCVTE